MYPSATSGNGMVKVSPGRPASPYILPINMDGPSTGDSDGWEYIAEEIGGAEKSGTITIAWAKQTGVVGGYENNFFHQEGNVTCQEFAQMMYNCTAYKDCDLSAKGDLNAFTDGDSVQECANRNSPINGHDGGTLEPAGTTTRAQAASILMRFGQNVVEK